MVIYVSEKTGVNKFITLCPGVWMVTKRQMVINLFFKMTNYVPQSELTDKFWWRATIRHNIKQFIDSDKESSTISGNNETSLEGINSKIVYTHVTWFNNLFKKQYVCSLTEKNQLNSESIKDSCIQMRFLYII